MRSSLDKTATHSLPQTWADEVGAWTSHSGPCTLLLPFSTLRQPQNLLASPKTPQARSHNLAFPLESSSAWRRVPQIDSLLAPPTILTQIPMCQ
jgi:hypothetical protein